MSDQSRRTRPLGAASAPRAASPAIAVVIALLAAVVGFFILKKLDNNDTVKVAGGTEADATPDEESQASGGDAPTGSDASLIPVETTTTTIAVVPGSYQVVVANGSGVNKAAGSMSSILANTGMKMGTPTNTLETLPDFAVTEIYYEPGFDAQGAYTAKLMGCAYVAKPMPTPKPVDEAALVGTNVLIVLGVDLATTPLKPCTDGAAAAAAPAVVDPALVTTTTAAA